jgi:O-methyltransferase involved in polyketide biosynthesis
MTDQPDMIKMILAMLKQLNENDEFFEVVASMMKKLYDALLEAGFTKQQATQIVAGFAAKSNN